MANKYVIIFFKKNCTASFLYAVSNNATLLKRARKRKRESVIEYII